MGIIAFKKKEVVLLWPVYDIFWWRCTIFALLFTYFIRASKAIKKIHQVSWFFNEFRGPRYHPKFVILTYLKPQLCTKKSVWEKLLLLRCLQISKWVICFLLRPESRHRHYFANFDIHYFLYLCNLTFHTVSLRDGKASWVLKVKINFTYF